MIFAKNNTVLTVKKTIFIEKYLFCAILITLQYYIISKILARPLRLMQLAY